MIPLATLRADAEALARQLPDAALSVQAADVLHPGGAGRKRAGSGEQFWQFRHYAQTDAADQIDWRRSARSDDYFVRETELETARTILMWVDGAPGFHWSGAPGRRTKAEAAQTLLLAHGILLAKSGERLGVMGGPRPASLGRTAADRLGKDLLLHKDTPLQPSRGKTFNLIASDFYDGIEAWRARLAPLAASAPAGVLLSVSDPVEHEFPFQGRTRLRRPGNQKARLFGRAETLRDEYLSRLADHEQALEGLAGQIGWALVRYRTDWPLIRGAAAVKLAVERFGAAT